jgi:hypothetical protein
MYSSSSNNKVGFQNSPSYICQLVALQATTSRLSIKIKSSNRFNLIIFPTTNNVHHCLSNTHCITTNQYINSSCHAFTNSQIK